MSKIADGIAQDLGKQIVHGQLRPGEKLPGELYASFRHKVSRQAYREALLILASKGLIEQRARSGTVVSDRSSWLSLDPDVLLWTFETDEGTKMLSELFELRLIVEPEAARFAALRRNNDHILRMRSAIEKMYQSSPASPEGQAADAEFHRLIFEAAQNHFLQTLSVGISTAVRWIYILKSGVMEVSKECVDDHAAILRAIEAQDADEASRAMIFLIDHPLPDLLRLRAEKQA